MKRIVHLVFLQLILLVPTSVFASVQACCTDCYTGEVSNCVTCDALEPGCSLVFCPSLNYYWLVPASVACPADSDSDYDGIRELADNCPLVANTDQLDSDGDGIGDVCDPLNDSDNDGIDDAVDNCPGLSNADQLDFDTDGDGDACDADDDNDGVDDVSDIYPFDQTRAGDLDGDAVDLLFDNCPSDSNPLQEDYDSDGVGDVCDTDSDNDGIANSSDPYPLNPSPLPYAPVKVFYGAYAGNLLGEVLASAGDVNNDGVDDIISGSPSDDAAFENAGSVTVLSGVDGKVLFDIHGEYAGQGFGHAVDTAGDVNQDGHADFIVGAPNHNAASSDGLVRVYSGATGEVLYEYHDYYQSFNLSGISQAGTAISHAGDLNNDGVSDFVATAYRYANDLAVFAFSGLDGSRIFYRSVWLYGDGYGAVAIDHIDNIEDINNDGFDDLLLATYKVNNSGGLSEAGRVYVLSGEDGSELLAIEGSAASENLGGSVAALGDINSDGVADFIVGDDGQPGPANANTKIFSGFDASLVADLGAAGVPDGAVDGLGDIDFDGVPDYSVGSNAYSGVDSSLVFKVIQGDIRAYADLNADGYNEVLLGIPSDGTNGANAGEIRVYSIAPYYLDTDQDAMADGWESDNGLNVGANDAALDADTDGLSNLEEYRRGLNPQSGDSDSDLVGDLTDVFPLDPSESLDTDLDGVGDNADAFPNDPSETLDTDLDGVGDNTDLFPTDPNETTDFDMDGIGDNSDPDADNDGVLDASDPDRFNNLIPGFAPLFVITQPTPPYSHSPQFFGWCLGGGADFNGDSLPDFVIGHPYSYGVQGYVGGVKVYFGGRLKKPVNILDTLTTIENLSCDVIKDIDGDGSDEVLVGGYFTEYWDYSYNSLLNTTYSYRLYSGREAVSKGGATLEQAIIDIKAAGDLDNDGSADYVFMTEEIGYDYSSSKSVFVNYSNFQLKASFSDQALLGTSVSAAGDINADGYDDLLVAYSTGSNGLGGYGQVLVLSGQDLSVIHTLVGDGDSVVFGESISPVGDLDADGYPDIAVGDPQSGAGVVWFYSGYSGNFLSKIEGRHPGEKFGSNMISPGDVNGDGYDDLVVAAVGNNTFGFNAGAVRVYSGANGAVLGQMFGSAADDLFGWSLSTLADYNNDGFADFLVGAPGVNNGGGQVKAFSVAPGFNDNDLDGLADGWETTHGLNTSLDDSAEDPDNDGLVNLQEFYLGTNPQLLDTDGDNVKDSVDGFPLDISEAFDADNDGVGNNADVYPNDAGESYDSDGDGIGNNADDDDDNDGFEDDDDLYRLNPLLAGDSDGDGVDSVLDAFPTDPGEQADTDGDGVGDNADVFPDDPTETRDSDNDGVGDNADAFENDPSEQYDSDSDGVGDNADEFPSDPGETVDTDKDGIGNNADPDDDNDGVTDTEENNKGTDPLIQDTDGDGYSDFVDQLPLDVLAYIDSDADGVGDNFDEFPADPLEDSDLDGDGIGDNVDDKQVTDISVGFNHSCAIVNKKVVCWGADVHGQSSPLVEIREATQLASGDYHSCALDEIRGVVCWGYNRAVGNPASYGGQIDVPTLKNPSMISASQDNSCVLDDEGVKCFGFHFSLNWLMPGRPVFDAPQAIAVGGSYLCVVDQGQIECITSEYLSVPVPPLVSSPVQLSSRGPGHNCVIDDAGLRCWGWNNYGQSDVPPLSNPVFVSTGELNTCAIDDSGVVCWGDDSFGQSSPPVLNNPTAVSAGERHSCAIDNGSVVCWGSGLGAQNIPLALIDTDKDGVKDDRDVFPTDPNEQFDTDGDGVGDNADLDSPVHTDFDKDLINDAFDNCPLISNNVQSDSDGDGIGNACDADVDGDGFDDVVDDFPLNPNFAGDKDTDKVDEVQDNCPGISNYVQSDSDGDGIGNACDADVDGDGFDDVVDDFPLNPNFAGDKDGDKVDEVQDNCPGISNYVQSDSDGDGIGNACDEDVDGDGYIEGVDEYPLNPAIW